MSVCLCGHPRISHSGLLDSEPCRICHCLTFSEVGSGPLVKRGDPYTSKLAAALQTDGRVSPTRAAILLVLDAIPEGQTDDDVIDRLSAQRFPATSSSVRTRRHELTGAGFVEEAGEGVSPYGNPALRWRLSDPGFVYVAKNRDLLIETVAKRRRRDDPPNGRERR